MSLENNQMITPEEQENMNVPPFDPDPKQDETQVTNFNSETTMPVKDEPKFFKFSQDTEITRQSRSKVLGAPVITTRRTSNNIQVGKIESYGTSNMKVLVNPESSRPCCSVDPDIKKFMSEEGEEIFIHKSVLEMIK